MGLFDTKRYRKPKKAPKKPWNPKASADPPRRYHIKSRTVTTGPAAMDALIRKLDEDAKSKKTTRRGGGGGYPINPKLGGRDIGGRKPPWRKRRILE